MPITKLLVSQSKRKRTITTTTTTTAAASLSALSALTAKTIKAPVATLTSTTTSTTTTKPIKMTPHNNKQNLHYQKHLIKLNAFSVCLIIASILVILPSFSTAIEASDLRSVKYKEWSKNITYQSSTDYNARGMQPLYNITHIVIKTIMGKDPLPDGYIQFDNYTIEYGPKVQRNDWADLLLAHWPLMLIVVLLGILIVLMPIIGFCYCICRCAGFCGGRSQTFDKRHDTCRRVFLGFLLIVLTIGVLFGVIIAFANNQYLENGIEKSTDTVIAGSRDTITFLDTTGNQIDHLLVYNYQQLSDQLQESLQDTSSYIIGQLEEESSAVSLDRLSSFLSTLPAMKEKLERMRTLTNDVRTYASQLSDGLRGVKRDLLTLLTKCSEQECKEFMNKYDVGTMDLHGIHYDQMVDRYFPKLPDLTDIINTVNKLSKGKIIQSSHRGRDVLQQIRKTINETIEPHITRIITSLNVAGGGLNKSSMRIRSELNSLSSKVGNATNIYKSRSELLMREFTPYRYYVGVAVSSVMLLILLLLVAALLCGICGKRPDGYGDDCCNKGAGGRFLITSVVIIFLTFSVMAVVATAHFLLGIVAYRGVCIPLEDPANDPFFRSLDRLVDLNDFLNPAFSMNKRQDSRNRAIENVTPKNSELEPLRFSDVLDSCRANQSIYKVLRLKNRIKIDDIKEFPERYKIQKYVNEMVDGIVLDPKDMVMLTAEEKKSILEVTESSLVDFDQDIFIDNLNHTITKHPLPELAARLRETANNLKSAEQREVQVGLRNQALHLETYEMNLVIPMRNESATLLRLAKELESVLIYKGRRLPEFIPMLLKEIEGAENFIKQEGAQFVKATAQNYSRYFMGEIERYLGIVVDSVENKIGYCAPLANVYAAGKTTICNRIVDPLNGFWLGAFLCLLIFLPTICVATKLASLYKKSDPYPGPMVESEYLYDAYSERDHIPLANGPKNKRRKNKDRRRRDYYEDSIGPGTHVVPTTGSAGVRDTRYNDMAPKHWDGGPPRYQNPPMAPPASEYERPPPYYYPGATEQD